MTNANKPGWAGDDPRNDRIYLGILIALMATVAVGAVVAITGEMVFENEAMKDVGFGAAVLGGVLYFGFRFWGRLRAQRYMEEKRRRDLAREPGDDEDEDADDGDEDGAARR